MDFIVPILTLITGFAVAYLWLNKKTNLKNEDQEKELFSIAEQKARLEERLDLLTIEKTKLEANYESQQRDFRQLHGDFQGLTERNAEQEKQLKKVMEEHQQLKTDFLGNMEELNREKAKTAIQFERNEQLQKRLEEQKQQFEENGKQLKIEFQHLANGILEEKSKKFTEQNSEQLKQILEPLGLRIDDFKKKVEEVYTEENKDRASLKEQIRQMTEMNQKMSTDAQNLTRALKGDSKTQGNWGEVILENILEKSGLRKGFEFEIQVSERTEENRLLRPDVVVKLPDDKFMIVDSKVSLTAYEQWVSETSEEQRKSLMKDHLLSLRTHIKGLAEKNYQDIYGSKSPDFVLLFIPIQPAFDAAMMSEPNLYNEAFNQNIILVSPTPLLATLSTVSTVWKQEYQNRNALEIADKSGKMYDKFVGFVTDLEKIGNAIGSSQKAYEDALNKLSTGRGNLVRQAEGLKQLGVKANKQLPANLMLDDDEEEIE